MALSIDALMSACWTLQPISTLRRYIASDSNILGQFGQDFEDASRRLGSGQHLARRADTTRDGVPENNAYCFVFRLEGGNLKELSEYMDTEMATQVLGEPE
jgi:hypothetical protein